MTHFMFYRAAEQVSTPEHHDFDLTDERGRAVGFLTCIVEGNAVESNHYYISTLTHAGKCFRVWSQTTRNRKSYGALTEDAYFYNEDEAKREAARRVGVALKRYTKKYAVSI
jgi:hypothetical protein